MPVTHIRDLVKVAAVASTNVVTAGATAVTAPDAQMVLQESSTVLHDVLLVIQIIVGVLSAIYISIKLWRAIREKRALSGSPTS